MHKEYYSFTKHSPLHFDTIHREITYDDNGNVVDIQDRNLDAEKRTERRRLIVQNAPLWAKIPAYIIVFLFFGFLWWLFILGIMGAIK